MPTQKAFKQRVRARMTKTGESYTTARMQLLHKGTSPSAAPGGLIADSPAELAAVPPTSDDAVRRATGRAYVEWFALLDGWEATRYRHPDIVRWLVADHGVAHWWAQSITVGYERARGMRATHEKADGFAIGATRTIAVDADRLLAAFTDARIRRRWLPDPGIRQRPTTARLVARFDWPEPRSRVAVYVTERGPDKASVAVQHERLPDAAAGDRLKAHWRERLGVLKSILEAERS